MSDVLCPVCGDAVLEADALSSLCAACLLETGSSRSGTSGLQPGSTVGPYEIVSPLGRGGMGQVHLAWDTRLCRTVAIKVLAPPFAADVERTRRLEREARIVAGLNHPRICAVYDVGREGDLTYIVMEHLEGETLAERLTRGPLPIEDVITLGSEIAEGLHGAHRHDITHRDLKPANIMLTESGAKLLDFGLAVRSYASGTPEALASSAEHVSGLGGTIQYMAPEQLAGKTADIRSDVFSFGLVLHEMLTVTPAFSAESGARLVGAVTAADPIAPAAVRPDVPPALERIIRRCLQRDPDERWQSLREVCDQLRRMTERRSRRPVVTATLPAAFILVLLALAVVFGRPHAAPAEPVRFELSPPSPPGRTEPGRGMAFISPDGRRLAWWVADRQQVMSLAVQDLDSQSVRYLSGTDRALLPFWSPDGREIAFFSDGQLKRVGASGGAVQMIAPALRSFGGCWTQNGTIVFAGDPAGPLLRVASRGGAPQPVTALDPSRGETGHRWPSCLPDGRRFIYFAAHGKSAEGDLWVGSIDSGNRRFVTTSDGGAVYTRHGIVLFMRGTQLLAQRINPAGDAVLGDPVILERLAHRPGSPGPPYFSASANGTLVWHTFQPTQTTLTWFDRSGRRRESVGESDTFREPALSPDGRFLIVQRYEPAESRSSARLIDLHGGTSVRLKADADVSRAVWSPDSRELVVGFLQAGKYYLSRLFAAGGRERVVTDGTRPLVPTDWSASRRFLAFNTTTPTTGYDVWILDLTGRIAAYPYLQSPFNEREARFSPDGRWVAYASNESGRYEVYVEPFHRTGDRWRISLDGGEQPAWGADGKELYYVSASRRLMATRIALGHHDVRSETTEALFDLPFKESVDSFVSFNVTEQGRRFLVNAVTTSNQSPINTTVVVNGVRLAER